MWQIVFNNDYRPSDSQLAQGRIPRWRPAGGASQWRQTDRSRRFLFDGGPAATLALHSHRDHFLPNYAYNRRTNGAGNDRNVLYAETDVCGDLKLSAVLVPRDATTQLSLLLYTGREELKAVIAAEGRAGLFRRGPSGDWVDWGTATVDPLTLDRGCQVSLANADYRATVSVGGKAVIVKDYDAARDHGRLKERLAAFERHVGNNNGVVVPREVERLFPTPRLAVQAEGGRCELLHVKVFRDVYYTCRKLEAVDPTPLGKYARDEYEEEIERATNVLGQEQDGPTIKRRGWGVTGRPIPLRDDDNPDLDEFFVLGDNSPASLDGRSWTRAAPTLRLTTRDGDRLYLLGTVPRYNLIGKAIFVYWPSGFRPPGLPALPIIPNVGRMRLIR